MLYDFNASRLPIKFGNQFITITVTATVTVSGIQLGLGVRESSLGSKGLAG